MTKRINISLEMKDMRTNLHAGRRIINKGGKEFAYDLAISILHELYKDGYSIFQTYTREDIKGYLGRRLKKNEFEELHESLGCFENIRMY